MPDYSNSPFHSRAKGLANHSKAVETATPERTKKAHSELASVESPDKALARRLKARLDREKLIRHMTVGMYALKTKDGHFGLPYYAASDNFALLAQKQVAPLSDCYRLGTFCLFDGHVTPVKKPRIVLDKGVSNE